LAELAVEGKLLRTQGRGTFVAKPKVAQVLELTSYTEDMRPVEWARSWYRGDRYKIVTRLRRPGPRARVEAVRAGRGPVPG
jgi:GntR family transcriptional regulator